LLTVWAEVCLGLKVRSARVQRVGLKGSVVDSGFVDLGLGR
jgi:hypothetical protein